MYSFSEIFCSAELSAQYPAILFHLAQFSLYLFPGSLHLGAAITLMTVACFKPPNDTSLSELINITNIFGNLIFRYVDSMFSFATEILQILSRGLTLPQLSQPRQMTEPNKQFSD